MAWHDLRWRDVDPADIPFDPSPAREITTRLLADVRKTAGRGTGRDAHLAALEDEIDNELLAAYGAWAAGWRWSNSEPGGGGPVQGWCCATHSLPSAHAEDGVARALTDWREWLLSLAATFQSIDDETWALPIEGRIERAAAKLLALVIERTGCEDAWYRTFATTLQWYVERLVPDGVPSNWIDVLVNARFERWVAPEGGAAKEVCAELGATLADRLTQPPAIEDALRTWQSMRARFRWSRTPTRSPGVTSKDGHVAYIETRDRPRDALRADRLRDALSGMRVAAGKGEPLTMSLLAGCQRVVLGLESEPAFRTRDAYAKAGRERYAIGPHAARDFDRCLAEAHGPPELAPALAARAYLDVCFFHPFDDGNARAARLALDHVLTRAGLTLVVADPVFAIPRWADDETGLGAFVMVLERIVGRATEPRD